MWRRGEEGRGEGRGDEVGMGSVRCKEASRRELEREEERRGRGSGEGGEV